MASSPRLPNSKPQSSSSLPCRRYARHQVELADVDTADISAALGPAYDFIEEQRAAKRGESAGARAAAWHCRCRRGSLRPPASSASPAAPTRALVPPPLQPCWCTAARACRGRPPWPSTG